MNRRNKDGNWFLQKDEDNFAYNVLPVISYSKYFCMKHIWNELSQ